MQYSVMNKDVYLGTVVIINTPAGEYFDWIEHCNLPYWLVNINNWFKERMSPLDRENMAELYECNKIKSLKRLINVTNIVSLSDTVWMKECTSDIEWKQVNPYKLSFSRALGITALDGIIIKYDEDKKSPEYATVGSYAKKWERSRNGKIQLIKKSREHWSDITGNEAFSEYYTAQIEKALGLKEGIEYINYDIREYKNSSYISICECFTSEARGFIPIALLVEKFGTDVASMYRLYKKMNQEYLFGMMLVVDALTMNSDRHLGNLGVMVNNETLRITRMAPIFDNNLALCPKLSIRDREVAELRDDMARIKPKLGSDFIKAALLVMDNRHYKALKNFTEFKFDRSGAINMNENRLRFLEQLVNSQANKLIKYYEMGK